MATISELTMLMNYEDRKRARLESEERQAARDNWSRFTTMATQNVKAAGEITDLAKGETDLSVLDGLSEKLGETLTGVDFVDQLINVRANEIDLRKKTVTATNRISDQIDELNEQMGDGITVGAKESLEDLDNQYRNIVSQQTNEAAILQNKELVKAREHLNLQLWKGEFDIDKEKEGYQFPEWMGKHEKSFFTQTVLPGVRVAEAGGDYTDAIKQLQDAFPSMRREKTAYESMGITRDKATEKEIAKALKAKLGHTRQKAFNEVASDLNAAYSAYADLKIDNKDLPTQQVFYNSLPILNKFTASTTGENLQNLDVKGAIQAIDRVIIINSGDDPDDLKSMLPKYTVDSDPLDPSILNPINNMIARNTNKDGSYNARYGKYYPMFNLIKARQKLMEIANTPGMLFEPDEIDTAPPAPSDSLSQKLKTNYN